MFKFKQLKCEQICKDFKEHITTLKVNNDFSNDFSNENLENIFHWIEDNKLINIDDIIDLANNLKYPIDKNIMINQHQDKIDWEDLSYNPAAIDLLAQNQENIFWDVLSRNLADAAIELLAQNIDKIDWVGLLQNHNPAAIDLIEQNQDKIWWECLSG